jgi:hypothetical protein
MEDESPKRPGYADWQNDRIVSEYFELDRVQRGGGKIVKQDLYNRLAAAIGGNPGGIEAKFQNISAVLASLEMSHARGLKPRPNIQQALADAVERYLDQHQHLVFPEPNGSPIDAAQVMEVPPPTTKPSQKIEATVERIAQKYCWAQRDARNRKLGTLGEKLVFEREQRRLYNAGKDALARRVRHVSIDDGDGVGFDILSFDESGEERLIEVKTTDGPASTDFFVSRTEKHVSEERSDVWRLHRVHLFSQSPKIFVLTAPLERFVELSPENWRASF